MFATALLLSAAGVFAHSLHSAELNQPWFFWSTGCWIAALILLIAISITSFRSVQRQRQAEQQLQQIAQLQRSILDSAGPMIIACDLNGRILIFNPAAERMLGYHADEVVGKVFASDLLPEGEKDRIGEQLTASLIRSKALPSIPDGTSDLIANFVQYVSSFPANRVRGFEMLYQRKDGATFPAMVHFSAVRTSQGEITGLVCISTDLTATKRTEHALHESEERYRDLFENSSEMIATLSPRGRYLYVNPSWQSHFGMSSEQFENLISFESAFPPEVQAEAAALFRRALNGEVIEHEVLRLQSFDAGAVEVEASLSCRSEEAGPVSVRCIFRDVTQQNRRERRLGMQLQVSQTVGESTSPDESLPKVLEALCTTLGCDLANLWVVDEQLHIVRFQCSWSTPGRSFHEFQQDSPQRLFTRGQGLPGTVWATGAPRWIEDLRSDFTFQRRQAARLDGLVTGWAIPVRVGNQVTAVIEFFSRHRMYEDSETMATVETVCASIGQFMARSSQESQVRKLNQQKEFILNSVADGIFGIDPEGRIDFANPTASRMLESSVPDLIGRPAHSILHAAVGSAACNQDCKIRRAFLLRETTSGQDTYYKRNGKSFPVEFSVTPMVEHGINVGSVLSFRDISQRYALDRMKDEFISTVSHELRTPLTSIRGALGLLSAGLLGEISEKASNLMRIAVSNSDRLVRLINDILDLERMQSGRAPLSFRTCALNELAQQAIDALQPMAEAAQVKLHLEAGPTNVESDSDRILQVITNLLSNAIKFSPPQSTVRIVMEKTFDGASFSVIDQGRGIPADKLESIFDRFQQVDASDSRQKGGTGLGLAICRTIAEQHGGRIWAEQNPDHGATFRVFLPERIQHLVAEPSISLHPPKPESECAILLCEGDAESRHSIAENLLRHGYQIIEADDGPHAVEIVRNSSIDAILIDFALPNHNGWETLRLLKEDETTAQIPVVVLSVFSRQDNPNLHGNAEAWVRKPVDETMLLGELARVLRGSQEKATVLIVEDDEDLARVILATFEKAGIKVQHAPTKRAALQLCQSIRYDLIILDLSLPDGDGFHIVDWLRQQEKLRRMPLVVYSAREVTSEEQKRLRLGPTEFLTKAKVQPHDVEALVLAMLRQHRTVSQLQDEAVSGYS